MLCELFRHKTNKPTRERDLEEEEEEREGKRQSGCMAFLPLLSDSLRPLSSDRRTSLCFVPPLVSVARRGQKAGDFGGRGWGGNGPPPPAACWSFHLNPSSGDGWGGRWGASLWAEGKGCWWWAAGWAGVCFREARQGNATDHGPTTSPTPTLQGVTRPVLPAPPTLAYLSIST